MRKMRLIEAHFLMRFEQNNPMRIISEPSLKCFLWDLRRMLTLFSAEMPQDIDFINTDSFYFYMHQTNPVKSREAQALMGIVEPFIPIIISQKSLDEFVVTYLSGDFERLTSLEQRIASRSKQLFINSAMTSTNNDWESMIDTCCVVRQQLLALHPHERNGA